MCRNITTLRFRPAGCRRRPSLRSAVSPDEDADHSPAGRSVGSAVGAGAAVDDVGPLDLDAMAVAGVEVRRRHPDEYIEYRTTTITHEVVMMGVDVGVVAHRASVEVELEDLAHLGQLVQCAVDGGPADLGQGDESSLVDLVGGEVEVVALEHLGDHTSLRGESEAACTQSFDERDTHAA